MTFPDKSFQVPCSFWTMIGGFMVPTVMYSPLPWMLVRHAKAVPTWYQAMSIATFNLGEMTFSLRS